MVYSFRITIFSMFQFKSVARGKYNSRLLEVGMRMRRGTLLEVRSTHTVTAVPLRPQEGISRVA
jgi:hypothetical protein